MYRREHPDIPGMFDARFREYNRPTLWREFQSYWLVHIVGLIMIIIGCSILFWNEGRAVKTAVSLEEGQRDITVPESLDVVFDENNGKLVLVSGKLNIQDALLDNAYGISINCVKLRRVVQVYQWYETEDQINVENPDHDSHTQKSYSYTTDWFEYHIDSSHFYNTLGHHNPHQDSWPANSSIQTNSRVKIGNYLLGKDVKDMFLDFKPFTSDKKTLADGIKIYAGLYYHSANLWRPEVGDYRVQFTYTGRDGDEFTVVGRQSGREIRPYRTESGEEMLLLHHGIRSATEVFRTEHFNNKTSTWIYRLGGWMIMFLGLSCVSNLAEMLISQHYFLRQIFGPGIAPLQMSASIALTLAIIGVGWIWYRPLVGGALVVISLLPYILPFVKFLLTKRSLLERYRLD